MKQVAIDKALLRLKKAEESVRKIADSRSYTEFESAWSDFLIAANGVYAKLEQGAKDSPRSRQWFGAKKRERRNDPLLQYLHQARNAEEHGLAPTSTVRPGSLALSGGSIHIQTLVATPRGINLTLGPDTKGDVKLTIAPPTAKLAPVTDERFDTTFQPPNTHLGERIQDASPLSVAKLGLTYLRALIEEAATLVR